MHELVEILDKKDISWRNNTLVLLDNASYHTSTQTMKVLSLLEIPVIFLGPYSYLMNPIELFWGMFKDADLNKENLPTGKSKYLLVVNTF